jgi:hypothetical protein
MQKKRFKRRRKFRFILEENEKLQGKENLLLQETKGC